MSRLTVGRIPGLRSVARNARAGAMAGSKSRYDYWDAPGRNKLGRPPCRPL